MSITCLAAKPGEASPRSRLLRRGGFLLLRGLLLLLELFLLGVLDTLLHGGAEVIERGAVEHLVEAQHDLEGSVHGVHGILAKAVAQARANHALDVVLSHRIASLVRHEGLRRAGHDDVTAESVDVHERAHAGNLERQVPVHLDCGKDLLRGGDLILELVRLSLAGRGERLGVLFVRHAVLHQLDSLRLVEDGGDVARHAEAVQELGA
mmetsp:Transcript_10852/g.30336  ORF Transcript_10852/g.30336 Transcript_10852/m.30336 type:complete len:208 (+) Transcript_10852:51-674(+)